MKGARSMKSRSLAGVFLCAYALISTSLLGTQIWGNKTFFSPRSQGADSARELAGRSQAYSMITSGGGSWTLSLAPSYVHSFRSDHIVDYFFGRNCIGCSGSQVAGGREACDIFTDYFVLPANYYSRIAFDPVRISFVFDVDFYWQMPYLCNRLFFKLHVPFEHAKTDLQIAEKICRNCAGVVQPTPAPYPAGYLGPQAITDFNRRLNRYEDVEDAFEGGNLDVGDIDEGYNYGRIWGRDDHTRIADLRATLGVSAVKREFSHLGIGLCVLFPTGTRPDAEFLYDAVVGNGHHWELGCEILGSWLFWRPDESCWSAGLYWQARVTHLFKTCQKRSYDFVCNPGSRYSLIAQFRPGSDGLFFADGIPSPYQYLGKLYPTINTTTLRSTISVNAQADIAFMFALQRKGLEIDLGYNCWVRGAEKLVCRDKFPQGGCGLFALKGDSQLYGFNAADEPIALCPTQQKATIHGGQGVGNFVVGQQYTNANVDNPVLAFAAGAAVLYQLNTADSGAMGIAQQQVNTSNPPIFLTDADINNCSGLVDRSCTNKIFAHIGYTWNEGCTVTPYFGGGAELEWGAKCNGIYDQGGVWIKGGFVY